MVLTNFSNCFSNTLFAQYEKQKKIFKRMKYNEKSRHQNSTAVQFQHE